MLDFSVVSAFISRVKLIVKYIVLATLPLAGFAFPATAAEAKPSATQNTQNLQDALRRIARNSNDSSALADAGLAALSLGDTRAAIGFLAKADQIYPRSGRVKAGLARALLQEQNPFSAIRYFDDAVANGIGVQEIAADRGLAYDLIGRNDDAQRDYVLALRNDQSDMLLSRYAISLGISGDVDQADMKLNPLLQKSNRDAWRNRAFIFAMNGKVKDANAIAQQSMQKKMARAIKPFFERMPKLTAAQKAAAVHFGHFPASENIGVDVATVQYAANNLGRGGGDVGAGLIPLGVPLGNNAATPRVLAMPDMAPRRRPGASTDRSKKSKKTRRTRTSLTNVEGTVPLNRRLLFAKAQTRSVKRKASKPKAQQPIKLASATLPKPVSARPLVASAAKATPTKAPLVSSSVERKVAIGTSGTKAKLSKNKITKSTAKAPVQLVTFNLAETNAPQKKFTQKPITVKQTKTAPVQLAQAKPSRKPLSDIMSDIAIPDAEKKSQVVPVDLETIIPATAKPVVKKEQPKKAPPKKPTIKHPKRYWVQVATGSNLKALKYDFRRMGKKNTALFKGKSGWTSAWGKTRRLVVGPFDDMASAKKFESGFRKNGGDGFAWVSAKGTEVNKLP